MFSARNLSSDHCAGREIPEEVAAKTDRENEFPTDMWKKLGSAGYCDLLELKGKPLLIDAV